MADKKYKNILIEREGGITFLWLNRPDKRNAMSPDLHFDMDDALDWLATDKETKVLVLGGKGEAWCAGQDLRLYFRGTQDNPEMRYKANNASHNWRWERLSQFPKPTIAMVQRLCLRRRVHAALRLRFRDRGGGRDLRPVGGELGHHSGRPRELEPRRHAAAAPRALLRGHRRHASTASARSRSGSSNFAVPKAKLREETVKLAQKLIKLNPNVVRYTKEAIRAVRDMTDKQARDYLKSKQDSLVDATTRKSASSTA